MLTRFYLRKLIKLFSLVLPLLVFQNSNAVANNSAANKLINFKKLTTEQQTIHYASAGDNGGKTGLLFIHGTPGSWSAFRSYLTDQLLREHFFMLSIDRLGWGLSHAKDSKQQHLFAMQSDAIVTVLKKYPEKQWIIIGHSLGASLAPAVNLKMPDKVSHLILLAGSLDPDLGKPRWYNWFASFKPTQWFMSDHLKRANKEIMPLRKELKTLDQAIRKKQLNSHLIVIQGAKDKLVSPKNAEFAEQFWQPYFRSTEIIKLEDAGHFIPWKNKDLIVETILQSYKP